MQNNLVEEKVIKIASFDGIDVFKISTDKFKTNTINIFFHDDLSKEHATKNALLPAVLRRGCSKYPSIADIALQLEELYGSTFDCGVTKKGERQIIQFYMEYVADKYTGDNENLFEKVFDLIYEIVTNPVLENNIFKSDYLKQEKDNLKMLIEGRVNDKVQYAVERCFEEMCKDEPYGIYDYGCVEDLEGINSQNLFEHYKLVLETLPIQVFVTGNIEDKMVKYMLEKLADIRNRFKVGAIVQNETKKLKQLSPESFCKEIVDTKDVTEKMSINQGKLSLGFRTCVAPDNSDYYSLIVYNGILGGGVHSKLFQNVREKASLAYYAFSRLEKFKGLMVISSGIEIENKDRAVNIILQQLDDIKAGNISDYEYDSTLKTIETGIKSLKDSQIQMVDFYLSQTIVNTIDSLDSIIENIKKVSKQDVINVAGKIKLDTIYFLTSGDTL